eukprot:901061-Pelagomonas_calceolata.AAC.1
MMSTNLFHPPEWAGAGGPPQPWSVGPDIHQQTCQGLRPMTGALPKVIGLALGWQFEFHLRHGVWVSEVGLRRLWHHPLGFSLVRLDLRLS